MTTAPAAAETARPVWLDESLAARARVNLNRKLRGRLAKPVNAAPAFVVTLAAELDELYRDAVAADAVVLNVDDYLVETDDGALTVSVLDRVGFACRGDARQHVADLLRSDDELPPLPADDAHLASCVAAGNAHLSDRWSKMRTGSAGVLSSILSAGTPDLDYVSQHYQQVCGSAYELPRWTRR